MGRWDAVVGGGLVGRVFDPEQHGAGKTFCVVR